MRYLLFCCLLIAACVDPTTTATHQGDLVGGVAVTGPTRAVVIEIGSTAGTCTGVLVTESKVLTAAHCFPGSVVWAGTKIAHPFSGVIERANVLWADVDPHLTSNPAAGPGWFHDLAVLTLDHALSIETGGKDALFDDGGSAPAGDVECVGAGVTDAAAGTGAGTLRTLTLSIASSTADVVTLTGHAASTVAPGDSGGPCWGANGRIVGIIQGLNPVTYDNWLTRPTGASGAWIAYRSFLTSMFDPSSFQAMAKTPAQWRTAKLDTGAGKQIVGVTSSGLEIYAGTRDPAGSFIKFAAKPAVSLTALPFTVATPDMRFVDVTGDGLTDLVVPSASEVDVLTASGSSSFHFPAVTTPLGSSGWTPANVSFANLDGTGGDDYLWIDATGVWAGLADGSGRFGAATKRLSWASAGAAGPAQLDATAGEDIGAIASTSVTSYSASGAGAVAATGLTSPILAPGTGWDAFSGFLPADKNAQYDWVAIRGQSLVVQLNDGTGRFPTIVTTPIEVGTGWENSSTMVDLNGDGSADWIGMDASYLYVKPGLKNGRFGRMKVYPHSLGSATIDTIKLEDIDGDGYRDVVAFGVPSPEVVTVMPFRPSSAGGVFAALSDDATWSWSDLVATLTKVVGWPLPARLGLCTVFTCGNILGTAGARKINGGGLLATMQVAAQGAPQMTMLADGLPRRDRWRWTPEYALRATADLDGDGSDELVFADTGGLVAAARLADGLGFVVSQPFGTALGNVALDATAQIASAGDTDHDGRDELLVQGVGGSVLAQLGAAGLETRWGLADTTTARDDSASVQQQEQHRYAALAVVPGTHVRAVMTGSGDADLYLRFGAAPTLGAFDCRPYTGTANEICDLVVPPGVTTAQLMVVGYTAASFHLDVTYTPAAGVVVPAGDLDQDGYADLVVASAHGWTVYRGTPQGPVQAFSAHATLGDRVIGSDRGVLVARADGLYRLSAQGLAWAMPWGGLDAASRMLPLGDLVGDGQTDLAAIVNGTLVILRAGPNGPVTLSTAALPAGANLVAAGELDDLPGQDLVVASDTQLAVYSAAGAQLVARTTGTLGITPDQQASASVAAQLPRTAGRRAVVLQLTSLAAPQ